MKKPNKKNEQKLKLYLSKVNDTKSGNQKDRNTGASSQASQVVQKGIRN
jgi:hypothetical protein